MHRTRIALMVAWMAAACLLMAAVSAGAQAKPKAGLWEYSTQMTMGGQQRPQMPQLPPGVQLPAGMNMPQGMGGPIVTQVCLTQAMIDKYGAPYSNPQHGNCQVTDVSVTASGMTAKIACTGNMNATGTITSTWSNGGNTTTSTMHMTGTMIAGGNSRPIDMTSQTTSTYKGPDCGSVKPMPMPASK
jgi:hypothetical protein